MRNPYNISKDKIFYISVFLICYIFLLISSISSDHSFDSYWHLQMGKDLLENGLSPWIDHYSFTHYGNEIASIPVIFQTLLAFFVSSFGLDNGFYFFKASYVTLLIFCLYLYFKQIKAQWYIVFLILPFLTYFINLRIMVRPEIISYVLTVICLSLYIRARESFTTKELLAICLLLLFWVNYHSPIFGYIIIFGLFLDRAIHKLLHGNNDFSWREWVIWGSIIFLIGFIKPSGAHVFFASLSLLNSEFGKYTMEYMPSTKFYSMNKIVYLSWVLSIYTMILSALKRQYGFAFLAIFLVYFSWSTVRLVTPVAIINFCILGFLLSQLSYSNIFATLKPSIRNSLLFISVGLPLLAFYILFKSAIHTIENRDNISKALEKQQPAQIVDYLKKHQAGGNILNLMSAGGYLINKLSPDFKVFIDGRTNILYPIDFVKLNNPLEFPIYNNDNDNAVDPSALNKVLKDYDVQYAIYKNNPDILQLFYNTDKLKLNFSDENFMLFSRETETEFSVSSQLMVFPMCWDEKLAPNVMQEISLAEALALDNSYDLQTVLVFLKDYLSQTNKALFLNSLDPTSLSLDLNKRLGAYIALSNHEYTAALKHFAAIKKQDNYDLLMMAYSFINNKDFGLAEDMLFYFSAKNKYPEKIIVTYDVIAIFIQLLKAIQADHELIKFAPSYRESLEEILKQANYNNGIPVQSILPHQAACKSFL